MDTLDDLPKKAQVYLKAIAELIGAGREATIVVRERFEKSSGTGLALRRESLILPAT